MGEGKSMLPILFVAGLLFVAEEPAKIVPPESAKTEELKSSKKAFRKPEVKAGAKGAEKEEVKPNEDSKEEPKVPIAKPIPRKRAIPSPSSADSKKRLFEAEAKASKLIEENARLQQEIARSQGYATAPITTPHAALAELQAGNTRFVTGKRVRTLLAVQDSELRGTLAKGQAPFAIIITCSDSRLVDNIIFDQELGRLFTIREAGNSPDIQSLASAEYAAEHLGSKLVVVMGHTACGAIKAVAEAHGQPLPGNLWSLQAAMAGLLESTHEDPNAPAAEFYTRLSEVNAQRQAQAMLSRSEILRELAAAGKLKVLPALYELGSGQVRFLEMPVAKGGHGEH